MGQPRNCPDGADVANVHKANAAGSPRGDGTLGMPMSDGTAITQHLVGVPGAMPSLCRCAVVPLCSVPPRSETSGGSVTECLLEIGWIRSPCPRQVPHPLPLKDLTTFFGASAPRPA